MKRARSNRGGLLRWVMLAALLIPAGAWGQVQGRRSELVFALNWARLETDLQVRALGFDLGDVDEVTQLDRADGLSGEIRFSRNFFPGLPQLRLGTAVNVSLYAEDGRETALFDIGDERLLLITPELQLSWRQPLTRRWFLEPGVGLGAVIARYQAEDVTIGPFAADDVDEWAVGFGVRPFLRAGYAADRWVMGFEASYRWTDIEWDEDDVEIDGELGEFMAGLFFGVRF